MGYRTETTKKFIEVVNDKYASCLKDKSIGKVLQKLQYTIKLAKLKVKELETNVQDDNDDPEVIIKGSSNRKSFQESLPLSRVTGNTRPDVKGLKASPPGVKISLAYPDASNPKAEDYPFLLNDARWGHEGGT